VKGVENVYALDKGGRADARAKLASSGEIVIQDLGSIVAGLVAAPGPGQVVLDVCASPGNKTSHLAAQMGNDGEIYSLEISASRSLQWKREMIRTGCRIATLIMADATKLPIRIQADVVLVDPPCSNSGVFARDPTSKWRLTPTRLKELVRAQGEILQEASEQLNEGGTLVYCTCSILPEENELVVETFLKKNPEYTLTQQRPFLGCPGLRGLSDCQRFFPHLHNCNGYFIAKMRKQ
jgi:16S rRNA (cytosine967-C5)-methyltransferase